MKAKEDMTVDEMRELVIREHKRRSNTKHILFNYIIPTIVSIVTSIITILLVTK